MHSDDLICDTGYWRDRKVLVTGGLGFIGSNLAWRLVNLNASVLLVDSLVPQYGGNLFNVDGLEDRVRINISDIRDPYAMSYLVHNRDVIFNLAGQTSHLDSMHNPFTDLEINSLAQLHLLEACRHHNPKTKIVFASTRQIYGKPKYLPVDERHPIAPTDVNGINKMAGEWYHILYNNVYGIRATALRLTNTYGPRMRIKDARQTFLGAWIRAAIADEPVEIWGGDQLRDFTYVDDCVSALLLAAELDNTNGNIYNLGGIDKITLAALAELLVDITGRGKCVLKTFPEERKRIDIGDYYSQDAAFRLATNWQPHISLADGLKNTVDFFKAHLGHYL